MSPAWKPSITVTAVIERDRRFLRVEAQTARLKQPAGPLCRGESLSGGSVRGQWFALAALYAPLDGVAAV